MRVLLQRVARADVRVDGSVAGSIGPGLVVLVGVGRGDAETTAESLAKRISELRVFRDPSGRTNLDIHAVGGEALVVSQFTLYADTRRGRRPGFSEAAPPGIAERLYLRLADALRRLDIRVETGRFGAEMAIELVNDGPFTIWLDTDERG